MRLDKLNEKEYITNVTARLKTLNTRIKLKDQQEIDEGTKQIGKIIYGEYIKQGKEVRTGTTKEKPWWNKKVLAPIRTEQNRARRYYLLTISPGARSIYQQWQEEFTTTVEHMKRHHWRKFLASQEPNYAFEALKFTKIKSSSKAKPLRKQTGEITNDKKEQTELLFEMFAQEGKRADLSDIPEAPLALEKKFKKITLNEIKTSISQLTNKKAPGLDQILNELLKILGNVLLNDLHKLFNACLQIGYFPRHLKKASTIIIQKVNKKDYSDPSAYCPITLISTVGKLF
ncbi:hypothetical protein O181_040691 [Austropuccinia psidii MF-1]|uniref:Reverse transcriptase domain-containing protein n=1 Tax=Austropuccinia psidii MF-1 TaxID=1389203 RepID=A0A9Q3DIB6_9BASI|nr:hypothetical protein [Austropuccinia psidii MF-1]